MADFCNKCVQELFDEETTPDIDVYEIYEKLEPGYAQYGHICEGCGMIAVAKSEEGNLIVLRHESIDLDKWETY